MEIRSQLCGTFVVRTENLSTSNHNSQGIQDLTIEVEPGEIYGFLGPDNSGKTTAIRSILNEIKPTSGSAKIFGVDHQHLPKDLHYQIGYLPQAFKPFGLITGEHYLRWVIRFHRKISWANILQLASDFKADLHTPIRRLSSADQKKIGLIRAFMYSPDLLILDEPTHELDEAGRKALFSLIKKARLEGHAVIYASKSIKEMEQICDRVATFFEGKLVSVERGIQLRSRALHVVEMHFAAPVPTDVFRQVPNVRKITFNENSINCTLEGSLDALLNIAEGHNLMGYSTYRPPLEETVQSYSYGALFGGKS